MPSPLKVLSRILIYVTGAIALSLVIVPWQQTSIGRGRVIAFNPNERDQKIEAPVDGRIARWLVIEGARVKMGDPIAEIADIDPDIMSRLEKEQKAYTTKLKAAETALNFSKNNVDRQRSLEKQGLSSRRAFELAEMEYMKLLSDVASQTAELAKIEVRIARQSAQVITAPRDGFIQKIFLSEGSEVIKAGEPIALLVPDTGQRAVELWVDGIDVPLITPGRLVRLQFEGWPAVQFSGWPSVAVGTFGGKVAFVDALDNGKGKFRVVVFPQEGEEWPSQQFLRQGVRAHGWILLNQVKLGYELWRRFNGFPPAIEEPANQPVSGEKQ
jgi:multidrug efflux pump subunit AcrA (membrane-fusion protein)